MCIEEAKELLKQDRSTLSTEQLEGIKEALLNDPVEFQVVLRGAILNENLILAFQLMKDDNPNTWYEKGKRLNKSVSDDQHFGQR
jgi:hypothetical protein